MSAREREARLPTGEAPEEGTVRMLDVGSHRVGLYRIADRLYALADRCPHRGAPLCAGLVASPIDADGAEIRVGSRHSIVRCPWHKWEFDIATGRSLVDPTLRARRYAVRVEDGEIVVTLDHPREDAVVAAPSS
ncbi:MAG TPA: Rieske (2Fe-2S) protein [Gaiellaceae bacterium]|nr:Rieske (2Fe-2S) protein [Gaiellaceae bacterium]